MNEIFRCEIGYRNCGEQTNGFMPSASHAIRLLAQLGHELRRPLADYLEEDIYELRIRRGRVNYRILYFFHGQNIAILAHGLVKEDVIPQADLTRAIKRKEAFLKDPEKHTYEENISHA